MNETLSLHGKNNQGLENAAATKGQKQHEKKMCKTEIIKSIKRAHQWRSDREEGGEVNSAQCENMQNRKEVVISGSCSKISTSGLSVMQQGHVRGQRHLMHIRWTKRVLREWTTCPKDASPTSVFYVKIQKYRPYSTSPTAFFIHMHVLHTTCHCLE